MECNCNNNNSNGGVIPWVRGNRLPLIICVYENVVTQEQVGDSTLTVNEMTRVPYEIQDNDTVTVIMKSGFRQVAMPFTTDGNKVMVTDNGELPTGAYTVEVTIERGDGARGRWQETRQVRIYENTSDAQLGEMYSIDADLFFYAKGDTGVGIANITSNPDDTLTITMTDGTSYTTQAMKGDKGDKGDRGEKGTSIVSFDVTGQTETSVIYTVTFSDDTTEEVAVPKGPQGDTGLTGNGISSTTLNSDYTLTIAYTDGTTYTTPSIRGAQGAQGVSVIGFTQTGETATNTMYNLVFSDGRTQSVAIPKGVKGDKGDTGNTGSPGSQGPKGDTVTATDYTLYNVQGSDSQGAMSQDATTKAISAQTGYYTCGTAAGTAPKVVAVENGNLYKRTLGGHFKVKMTNANTAASGVTLQIGSETAAALWYNGAAASASNSWEENEVISVYYDGSVYQASNAQGGGPLKSDIIDGGIDFSIRDENNNAIVKFKNGHVKTKRFDSETWIKDHDFVERLPDFAIIDENNNGIIKFENGHVKTKNFDSENLLYIINDKVDKTTYAERFLKYPKTPLFDYAFKSAISSDFSSNSNWSISNERLVSINAGVSNRLIHNKSITISQKYTYCKFTIHSDTYFGIGWLSSAFAQDGSLFTINANEGSINIHEAWSSADTLPSVKYTLPYTFIDGRDYIIKIRKDAHTNYISIIDCLTGTESETIQSVQTSTSGLNEFAGGRQMNKMQLVHLSGVSPDIEYIRCCAAYQEPLVIVYGDSVTEGDRVYNGDTYVDLMKQELGEERVMCSGQSGSKVADVIARMQFELPLLKPKFVMVTIGSNGSNTQALFNQAKSIILDNNATPIFNIPPMGVNVLDEIRQFVANLNVTSARFDIATAVNNDITQGKNSSLFADNTHPNKNGHIAMFKRLKSDCNILFNY